MKTIKFIAVAVLCVASYFAGSYNKNTYYNDACRMADLIRAYEDAISEEDSNIEDYGCFEELEGICLWDDALGEPVNIENYAYCY